MSRQRAAAPVDAEHSFDYFHAAAPSADDLEALRLFCPVLERRADDVVDAFVEEIRAHEPGHAILKGPQTLAWFKRNQRGYLFSLTRGCADRNYLVGWHQEGKALEWLGLSPAWYLGAYSFYQTALTRLVCEEMGTEPALAGRVLIALNRRLVLDLRWMVDSFLSRGSDRKVARVEKQMEKMAAVGQMATGLAHEIGTPLNVISGNAEYLLMDLPRDDPRTEELTTIVRETKRVSMLIAQLLKFARPAPPTMEPVDVELLLSDVLMLLTQEMGKKQVELSTRIAPLPAILGDANQLKQVFVNIILNAIHAMPGGGQLEISAKVIGPELVVEVKDTGHGIKPEHLPRIFDPFFTTKDVGKGTGLGLSVCYRIVNEHSGRIEVSSRVGEGAAFRVVLPLLPETQGEGGEA